MKRAAIICYIFLAGCSQERHIQCAGNPRVIFGMTENSLKKICGTPQEINVDAFPGIVSKQFVYGDMCRDYIYTKNGLVSSWQYDEVGCAP